MASCVFFLLGFALLEINSYLSKKKKLLEEPDYQKIVDLLTDGKGNWSSTRKNPHESIARGSLKEETKVWFHFIGSILLPPKQLSIIR